jgi:O-glycosyl hydrolase
MKAKLLLFLTVFFTFWSVGFGQTPKTTWDVNFDDGTHPFTVINADGANPSYTLSITNGILDIKCAKKGIGDWSFLQIWRPNLDLSGLTSVQFRVRTSLAFSFSVRLKSENLSDPSTEAQIEKTTAIPAGADYQYVYLDFADEVSSNGDFQANAINEIQVECGNGASPFSGDVYFDYLRFGMPKIVPPAGSGLKQPFDTLPGIKTDANNTVSVSNGKLKVNVNATQRWSALTYDLNGNYDFSGAPYVNIKIKPDQDMIMQVFLVDNTGKGYKTSLVGSQYKYVELTDASSDYRQARVYKSDKYVNLGFNFAGTTIPDLTKIAKLLIVCDGTAISFSGSYSIDEMDLGDQAIKKANISQMTDYSCFINSGAKQIIVPDVRNADHLVVKGGSSIIQNLSVTPITYYTVLENSTRAISIGTARIGYTTKDNVSGNDSLTVIAKGLSGYADDSMTFKFAVTNNNPPTIDKPDSVLVLTNSKDTVELTGITDGDKDTEQALTFAVSSSNTNVVDNVLMNYKYEQLSGSLTFDTKAAGKADIKVIVTDALGAKDSVTFTVWVYQNINHIPTINQVPDQIVVSGVQKVIKLTGISDGDGNTQPMTITASVSTDTLVAAPVVNYTQDASNATFTLSPIAGKKGTATITLTLNDHGGTAQNQGDKITQESFNIIVGDSVPTGYTIDLNDPNVLNMFGPEGAGTIYFLSIVDTLGSKALKVHFVDKWDYAGIFTRLPYELNLTKAPVVSMDILSIGDSYHWNYLYDALGTDAGVDRNIQNSSQHMLKVAGDGAFHTLTFDYRQPGDLNNSAGNPIDIARINALLINMHKTLPAYPFTNTTGTVYIKNISFGYKAVFSPLPTYVSCDSVAIQSVYANTNNLTFKLTGLKDGKGGIAITPTASATTSGIISDVTAGTVNSDSTLNITFSSLASGKGTIKIILDAAGSVSKTVVVNVYVVDPAPTVATKITIDKTKTYQTIRGLGTFIQPQTDILLGMGCTAVRLGVIGNQWEPVNDNDDPYVLDMTKFDYSAFDWDAIRKLKDGGVKTFFLTSWSAPAWMKRNLCLSHKEQAVNWENTDNVMDTAYNEEFAENLVALVKAFKEKSDVDLTAICLQNEPYFNEPYPSAILGPIQFAKLIKVVGDRFASEGITTGFYMPEQVFGFNGNYGMQDYYNNLVAVPEADAYTKYFAVHGYDASGITSSFPTFDGWVSIWNMVKGGTNPKELWMTETGVNGDTWDQAMSYALALQGSLYAGNISVWTDFGGQITSNQPNMAYYAAQNFYKFVRPGAVRVELKSDNNNILSSAYKNADGKFTIVMVNRSKGAINTRILGNNLPEHYTVYRSSANEKLTNLGVVDVSNGAFLLAPYSITTLVSDENLVLTINQVADTTVSSQSLDIALPVSGISDGHGSVTGLTLAETHTNATLFDDFSVSSINADGTATVNFKPAANNNGNSWVTLTVSDGTNSKKVNFYIHISDPLGLLDLTNSIKIYPNPVKGQFKVEALANNYQLLTVKDLSGRTIVSQPITSNVTTVNLEGVNAGLYIVEIAGKSGSNVQKIVVE